MSEDYFNWAVDQILFHRNEQKRIRAEIEVLSDHLTKHDYAMHDVISELRDISKWSGADIGRVWERVWELERTPIKAKAR